ncbi:MAG: hypothetical protein CME88_05520 [Hirschia sp.]|nr:hypothetical protein [Hirschia sp.]MBF17824.1 hypothetical protein [Hirschia sp.]
MFRILVDADACPVKNEVYKVAERHGAEVTLVSDSWINAPRFPFIKQIVVNQGADAADDWIAEHCDALCVVVTSDIPLAERCLNAGSKVLSPRGKPFTPDDIGSAIATRALMEQLRSTGDQMGGPPPFSDRDRSSFLQAIHETLTHLKREHPG